MEVRHRIRRVHGRPAHRLFFVLLFFLVDLLVVALDVALRAFRQRSQGVFILFVFTDRRLRRFVRLSTFFLLFLRLVALVVVVVVVLVLLDRRRQRCLRNVDLSKTLESAPIHLDTL